MIDLKITPMMQQFNDFKKQQPDAFLFFRCGDFYELFGNDALKASQIMDITLTKRQDIPMCGVPYHSVDFYLNKMIKAGKKVAICEQIEDPKLAKGIVKRAITQIVTPGNIIDEKLINSFINNYLASINKHGIFYELSYIDISTGEFYYQEFKSTDINSLFSELLKITPREIIISDLLYNDNSTIYNFLNTFNELLINHIPEWIFNDENTHLILKNHFNVDNINLIFDQPINTQLSTPAVLLKYLKEYNKSDISHINKIIFSGFNETMYLDISTIKNLELLKNNNDHTTENSLFMLLDRTNTNMGKRLLKRWIIEPLIVMEKINKRNSIVEMFFRNSKLLRATSKLLSNINDLERLITRVMMNRATPKDLISIKCSLNSISELKSLFVNYQAIYNIFINLNNTNDLTKLIELNIREDAPTSVNEGGIIKENINPELDKLHKLTGDIKGYINELEVSERKKLGLPTLKIKYNRILGYFFEVSRLQSEHIGSEYILKQSLVNVSRFTTKELSEIDSRIVEARERINDIEFDLFNSIIEAVKLRSNDIQKQAVVVAETDVLVSFAEIAVENGYIKPNLSENSILKIKNGRHPIVETKIDTDKFVPNDLDMNIDNVYINIITGPNMSGKSTFLRQNALIVLMAQIGSFVPAEEANIGIVDRIFSRIGSGDNLARGESTFFVEMSEAAGIIKNATNRSFIILDEIGRGTSTYDGLSIAQSVIEYIADRSKIGAKTLFATHYHEITKLSENCNSIINKSVSVIEENGKVIFLHKIVDGPAEKSYGIFVAKLAGMPEDIISKAKTILDSLEKETNSNTKKTVNNSSSNDFLFDTTDTIHYISKDEQAVIEKIKKIDINNMTPIQSLNILNDLMKKLK